MCGVEELENQGERHIAAKARAMSKQLRPVRNAHLDHKVCATAGCNFMVSEKSRLRAGRCIGFHEKVKRLCTAPSKSLPVLRGDACRETQTLLCVEPH